MKWHVVSLLCIAVGMVCCPVRPACAADAFSPVSQTLGVYKVTLLPEEQREGDAGLLVGARKDQVATFVPTGKYPTAVNAFLVRTPDATVLVDAAFGKKLFDNLKREGVIPEQIDIVLLTHMHPDHIGGLLVDGKPAFPNAKLCLAEQERTYWTDKAVMDKAPDHRKQAFKQAQDVLRAYGENVWTFSPSALDGTIPDLVPGIKAIAAFGHTPGHTVYQVGAGKKGVMIWGDLTHAMAIQMPLPEVAMVYDVDPQAAIAARQQILKYTTAQGLAVAGMHIAHPGMGKLVAKLGGGYMFTPLGQ